MVKILAALSILNSSGASPGATKKVAALVARATCSGGSHSSDYQLIIEFFLMKILTHSKIHFSTQTGNQF